MSVSEFLETLVGNANRLGLGFETATQKDFVWLKELATEIASSSPKKLRNAGLALPKTPSANKRRAGRKPKRETASRKKKEDVTQTAGRTRQLRKRTASIAPQPRVGKSVSPPKRRTTRASIAARKTKTPPPAEAPATPETVTRGATEQPETPITVQKAQAQPPTPDTVSKAVPLPEEPTGTSSRTSRHRKGTYTVTSAAVATSKAKPASARVNAKAKAAEPPVARRATRSSMAAQTVESDSKVEAKEALPSAVAKAPTRGTRVTRASIAAAAETSVGSPEELTRPSTPDTVVKSTAIDTMKTPSARFAAALAAARSPSTVTKKRFNDPVLAPGSVTKTILKLTGSAAGKGRVRDDLPPPRMMLDESKPASSGGKPKSRKGRTAKSTRKLFRKGNLASPASGAESMAVTKMRRVETLVSPKSKDATASSSAVTALHAAADVAVMASPTHPVSGDTAQPERKRKSGHLEDDADSVDAASETSESQPAPPSFNAMKRDVLSVSRQMKRRKPTARPSKVFRTATATSETESPAPEETTMEVEVVAATSTDAQPTMSEAKAVFEAPKPAAEPVRKPKIITNIKSFVSSLKPKAKAERAVPKVAALKAAERQRAIAEQKAAAAAERKQKQAEMRANFYTAKGSTATKSGTTIAPKKTTAKSSKSVTDVRARMEARAAEERQRKATAEAEKADRLEKAKIKGERREAEKARQAEEQRLKEQRKEARRAELNAQAEKRRQTDAEAKLEETRRRKAALKEKERQMLDSMAARKAELAERTRQFEIKAAKQKAEKEKRTREQAELQKARAEKLRKLEEIRMRRQRELEEERRQRDVTRAAEAAAAKAAATAAVGSSVDSYDLSGLLSDASSDEEDNPRCEVPRWAQGAALKNALYNQFIFTPDEKRVRGLFPSPPKPVLADIFNSRTPKVFRKRTSSAHWDSTPNGGLSQKA